MAKFEEDQVRRVSPGIHLLREIPSDFSRQLCFFHGTSVCTGFPSFTGFLPVFPWVTLVFDGIFSLAEFLILARFLPVFCGSCSFSRVFFKFHGIPSHFSRGDPVFNEISVFYRANFVFRGSPAIHCIRS